MGSMVFAGPGSGPALPEPSKDERRKALDELSQLGQELQVETAPAAPKRQSKAEIAAKVKGEG